MIVHSRGSPGNLTLTSLDENREIARERIVAVAQRKEAKELEREMVGVELREGDLVLLRRFNVVKHHGLKLESQCEGPYRLVEMSYHQRSGRLQDLEMGDIVKVQHGGLRKRVHVNDLKLFVRCSKAYLPADKNTQVDANSMEIAELELSWGWQPGSRRFSL